MVFPGVLRGLPGPRLATTPTDRPRRSLSYPGVMSGPILGRKTQHNEKRHGAEPLEDPFRRSALRQLHVVGGGAAFHLSASLFRGSVPRPVQLPSPASP